MTVENWSLSRALSEPVDLVQLHDLAAFRAAASGKKGRQAQGCPDQSLVDVINYEIGTMIMIAEADDRDDPVRFADQERFKAAYAIFIKEIESLSEPLRTAVKLPDKYVRTIRSHFVMDYAHRRSPGRPVEWRRDDFYRSMLFIFELMTGERGAGSAEGPAVRFMRAFVDHLQKCLERVDDKGGSMFANLQKLWKLPTSETFLKDWFGNKGKFNKIHEMIECRIATERQFNDSLHY